MPHSSKSVVVGLSGGVDSSVAALLLKEQGYEVIGLFMKNWEEEADGLCHSALDYQDALAIAAQIGIPCYTVDFTKEYKERVFDHFVQGYQNGVTPNPDVLCNKEIKFDLFLEKATKQLGADYLATGHYCRTLNKKGSTSLLKGSDPSKDQSYFLYHITEKALSQVLFPVGNLPKTIVRQIAKEHGLKTHSKKDSTGICFIGERPFREFLSRYLQTSPGPFVTPEGRVVGQHWGASFYTIGQRKGLGIGGMGKPWFVVDKDLKHNTVIVVQGDDHPLLWNQALIASHVHWINERSDLPGGKLHAKIRYRTADAACQLYEWSANQIAVVFDSPQKAITPAQAIVFYQGEICLGGATIEKAMNLSDITVLR